MEAWKKNLWVCYFAVFIVSIGMSQMAPILPLYIEHLGISDTESIERWSGIIFGCNFISLAIFSPIWGKYSDRYGRKPMALRASLWLSVIMFGLGLAQNVYQLALLRLIQGALSGFQGAIIPLIATQTPVEKSGWALGIIFTGQVSGALLGPLIGGYLSELVGYRQTFFIISAFCFLGFLALAAFVKEDHKPDKMKKNISISEVWHSLPNPQLIRCLFVTTFLLQFALISIQPILTVYISQLSPSANHIALIAGVVYSCSGLASMLTASRLGHISDHIGAHKVLLGALLLGGIVFIPQAFVTSPWQLGALRFGLGIATAGLLPSINSLIRQNTPKDALGRIYGLNQSAQFVGMFSGSFLGGTLAAWLGISHMFFITAAFLLIDAYWCYQKIYKDLCHTC
jgi:MFS family permease